MARTKSTIRQTQTAPLKVRKYSREAVERRTMGARRRLMDRILQGFQDIKAEADTFAFKNAIRRQEDVQTALDLVADSVQELMDTMMEIDVDKFNEFYPDV